ncbi:phospholipase D-like domain-containing protein [Nitrosarchaeum sp.]|uniref:phospholipase D-like domain-containing protein n=1 Tax=Nitrosarchaeum sp. TaxID=2026886 RepID=UPI00247C3D59|nr:phospholipase D-like domain-containing protein [Nitrosarchaeum sp.]MCV0411381.1 hypothetical protein [Nitrosarchaeum sp.]
MKENKQIIRSPLFEKIRDYIIQAKEHEQIFLYVPYIKTKILSNLLENVNNKIIIITTWEPNDILSGSSELELYQYCKENNITLYINNKIHLKIYSINFDTIIISSGNISQRGLMPEGNYEIGCLLEQLTSEDRLYFEKIRNEAILVNDEIYQQLKKWYDKQMKEIPKQIKFEDIVISQKNNFLISSLPMTKDIDKLVEGYERIRSNRSPSDDPETNACIFHDLANYGIELGLSKEGFLKKLKIQFFAHPFIQKIDEFINPEAYFGRIKEWIQDNCTDVPVPSRRELTGNVQVLYEWFEKLSDGKYVRDRPQHSERLRKIN